ncbi:MAG: DUF3108 domain-containing protein [Porticoccaceae bacterium]|nr:DUF3108 domain-containing protein [Porticoccaceae bacterium]
MRAPFTKACQTASTFFVLCLLNTPLLATEVSPTSLQLYQANYSATFNGIPIEAERQLVKLEHGYRLETSASNLIGKVQETERLHLNLEGAIIIDGYTSKRSFFGSKRKEQLVIDHEHNKAIYTRKNKRRETELHPNYFGPISYQIQLRRDLAKANTPLEYTVISHGKIKHYQFERLGEEIITTGLGDINAEKIRRVRDKQERETIFWMAKKYDYLPVKVWQREEDGESYEMLLKSLTLGDRE